MPWLFLLTEEAAYTVTSPWLSQLPNTFAITGNVFIALPNWNRNAIQAANATGPQINEVNRQLHANLIKFHGFCIVKAKLKRQILVAIVP
jgi:hypothetical protein